MRTLLIDNYDSYTYNLFQLLAVVNGEEPTVVRNDVPESGAPAWDTFDNVVISPGPGHPGRERDFGISARVLAEATVPVLGVCLGHQGIALGSQAEVVPAPAPKHGHLTTVRHDGRDLFRGLPQHFTAVRYHSLCVREPLPDELEGMGWSEDGVLMALRHRHRPLWGVQFHPESIASEFGPELIANFRDLTLERRPRPVQVTSRPRPAPADVEALVHNPKYRLHVSLFESTVDTESAFSQLFADSSRAFWLDSAQTDPGRGRFSFLGDGSGPLSEFVRYDSAEDVVHVERQGQLPRRIPGNVFDYLQDQLQQRRTDRAGLPFDFACGYVGYFGYELKGSLGSPNRYQARTPDASWLFADRLVVVDHHECLTYLLCLAENSVEGELSANHWLDDTLTSLRELPPAEPVRLVTTEITNEALVEPWLVRDRKQYLEDIARCKDALVAGESYEICLTTAAELPAVDDAFDFYRRLRRYNPAPYAAFLRLGDVEIASSSPERFLKLDRQRILESKPIKGTAPRHAVPSEDTELKRELANSAKTRAENLMIVDLLRNDLGQVCEVGSVHVPKLMAVESYPTVHQLVSTVRGKLRPGADAVDCVRACFPGGSMTGAPKLRTMEIIDGLETQARGVYSGTLGYLSCNGTADLNIVIRTAVFADGMMHLGAGGAIVLDSDPEEEYAEVLLKAAAPLRALFSAAEQPVELPGAGPTRTAQW
ncbi:aminodeoxychorismate synthase component I [Streptomyces lydicus]|uniref:aminodeoxychorismate synthase component I n=1 Tax=Streptomyces lydicus TaxID=47763 RepID=UPI0010121D6F|nr:aminodeoxychorismate synthase component I [Streptomyces lydicus]MCZ1005614.1 aminodeoxychorismate synthase component I [Streptomyces lydicus]